MIKIIESLYFKNKILINFIIIISVFYTIFLSIERKQRYLVENEEDHFYRYIGDNFYTTCGQAFASELLSSNKINWDAVSLEELKKHLYLPPHFTKDNFELNVKGPKYSYAPHTLPLVKFLCEKSSGKYTIFLFKFYLPILLFCSALLVLLLWRMVNLFSMLLTLGFFWGAFGGLDANLFIGNSENLSSIILFFSLFLFYFAIYRSKSKNQLFYILMGSFVLGYYMAFKFVMIYLILVLVFLPLNIKEKILCILMCLFSYFLFPFLSYLFQTELMKEIFNFYFNYFTGKQVASTGLGNSLMNLQKEKIVEICRFDLGNNTIYCFIHFYLNKIWPSFKANLALWMPLSLIAFVGLSAFSVSHIFLKYSKLFENKKVKLREGIILINDYLVENKKISLYITTLAFFVLYIILPRLQYHYIFSLVVISTFLFMQLKLTYQIPVFFFCILIPIFFDYTIKENVSSFFGCYTHIVTALFAFVYFMFGLRDRILLGR